MNRSEKRLILTQSVLVFILSMLFYPASPKYLETNTS